MSAPSDDHAAVRLAGQEVEVAGMDALVALARAGQIGAGTQVRLPGSSSWVAAAEVAELRALLKPAPSADPWDAWEAMEEEPSVAPDPVLPTAETTEGFDELTDPGIPMSRPRPGRDAVEELPDSAVDLVATGERTNPPKRWKARLPPAPSDDVNAEGTPQRVGGQPILEEPKRKRRPATERGPSGGKVIAFPARPQPPVQGAHALAARDVVPLPTPRPPRRAPKKEEPPPTLRWHLPLLALIVGGLAVASMRWYVITYADLTFPSGPVATGPLPPVQGDPEAPPLVQEPPAPEVPEVASPFAEIEDELRGRMLGDLLEVARQGDLEDALLIELQRLRLDVVSANARVTEWTGRNDDMPQTADFQVVLRSTPSELDRELAAVGLVVGKYTHHYSLTVGSFEVVLQDEEGVPRQSRWSADEASLFYLERVDLQQYLEEGMLR